MKYCTGFRVRACVLRCALPTANPLTPMCVKPWYVTAFHTGSSSTHPPTTLPDQQQKSVFSSLYLRPASSVPHVASGSLLLRLKFLGTVPSALPWLCSGDCRHCWGGLVGRRIGFSKSVTQTLILLPFIGSFETFDMAISQSYIAVRVFSIWG